MRELLLSRGAGIVLLDDPDYEWAASYNWSLLLGPSGISYAKRNLHVADQPGTSILMHRQLLVAPPGVLVDHHDHNGLNNQRLNLRECARDMNGANRIKRAAASSRFKGVSRVKGTDRWCAYIRIETVLKHLGRFADEVAAARAYDTAAIAAFAEFARPNFPGDYYGSSAAARPPELRLVSSRDLGPNQGLPDQAYRDGHRDPGRQAA